jgi:hypothetical protein
MITTAAMMLAGLPLMHGTGSEFRQPTAVREEVELIKV